MDKKVAGRIIGSGFAARFHYDALRVFSTKVEIAEYTPFPKQSLQNVQL